MDRTHESSTPSEHEDEGQENQNQVGYPEGEGNRTRDPQENDDGLMVNPHLDGLNHYHNMVPRRDLIFELENELGGVIIEMVVASVHTCPGSLDEV